MTLENPETVAMQSCLVFILLVGWLVVIYLAGRLVGVHHGSGLGSRVDDHAQYTAGSHHRVGPQRVVYAQRVLLPAHVSLNILRNNENVFL